jgi:hypothetical protein
LLTHRGRAKRAGSSEKGNLSMKTAPGIFALAFLFLLSPPAAAQEGPGKACKADREKFCAGMKGGDGGLGRCMKAHDT